MYKMLIVDDEYLIREGLKNIIEWNEFSIEIASAANGTEALEYVKSHQPEIVITDIKMPVMNGLELIENLSRHYPSIKVIVISGFDDFEFVKKSMLFGVENYILKPVNENELLTTVIGTVKKIESELNEKVVTLQDLDIIKDNMFCSLLYYNFELKSIRSKFQMMNIHFGSGYYYAAVIKLLGRKKLSEAETVSIKQDLLHYLTKTMVTPESIYSFFDYSGNLVVILFDENPNSSKELLYSPLRSFIEYSKHIDSVDIFLTVGSSTDNIYTISNSYNDAITLQDYLYVYPQNTIISYDDISDSNSTAKQDFAINFKELSRLILSGNLEELETFYTNLSQSLLCTENASIDLLGSTSMDIVVELSRIIKSIGLNTDKIILNYSNYYNDFTNIKTFKDSLQWAKNTSIAAAKSILSQKEQPQNLIQRIIRYVDENYSRELSIKSLSVEFNVTPNYIGQLFKREKERHFLDYIHFLRIEKAKELIRNSNLKANEIASKVGYIDADYFYKVFKKYEGISPTEYKQL